MKQVLLLFLLISSSTLRAQFVDFHRWDLYDSSWYVNAVELQYFGWSNDTSSMMSSVEYPQRIHFGEQLELHDGYENPSDDPTEVTSLYYTMYMDDFGDVELTTYRSKKDLKKDKQLDDYILYTTSYPYEIVLASTIATSLFEDPGVDRFIVLSPAYDSAQLITQMLGNWEQQSEPELSKLTASDTLTLHKTPAGAPKNDRCQFNFSRIDGIGNCQSDCFTSVANHGGLGFPPMPYDFYGSRYAVDIANKRLFFHDSELVFDILLLNNSEMQLKLYQQKE